MVTSLLTILKVSKMRIVSSLLNVSGSGAGPAGGIDASDLPGPSAPQPVAEPVAKSGSVGTGRFAKNLRLLFVNGCSYEEWESQAAAQRISSLFGRTVGKDIRVHYAYVPMKFSHVVGAIRHGVEPQGCDLLLTTIRERLQEMDTTLRKKVSESHVMQVGRRMLAGGCRLAIFLHSGGGAFFKKVMERLTSEERQKIDVFSFGSAWMFNKGDFHTVLNAVACWDPFPMLGRIVSGRWFPGPSAPIVRAGSSWQMPVVSHKFLHSPYQETLRKIVSMYVDEVRYEALLPPPPIKTEPEEGQ